MFKKLILTMMTVLFFAPQAFGIKPDFDSVREYHNQEIAQLLKDYTLEDSLTIRVELKKIEGKTAEETIVNIPGLYQKTGEAPDANISNVLNQYERKIVFIKKRQIAEEEMTLVKSSMSERLFLPKDAAFTILDDTPKLNDAVQNLQSDFVFGAYETLIKNGQFLWILIFSIGFIVALWVLARVWKAKGEGGGEISMAGGSGGGAGESESSSDSAHGGAAGAMSLNSSEFETFNFSSLCQNINDARAKAPGATSQILWNAIPDLQSQIQFYEIIRIQNQVPTEVLTKTCEEINDVYSFEKRLESNHSRNQGKGFDKNTLSLISVELARLKFIQPHKATESCYKALYPNKADHMKAIFTQGLDAHYITLYKLFKDQFMNYVSSQNDPKVLEKINDLLMFDPDTDHPSDEQYQAFTSFVKDLDVSESNTEKKEVNSKVVNMIYGLSEEELFKVDAMKSNEDLKAQIPTFKWINLEDATALKTFFINLSGAEIKCFLEHDPKHEECLAVLDDRTQFRVKEKTAQVKGSVNWKDFRNKIKRHYKYEGSGNNEQELKKAS